MRLVIGNENGSMSGGMRKDNRVLTILYRLTPGPTHPRKGSIITLCKNKKEEERV